MLPEIGTVRVRRLLDAFGTLERIFAAPRAELQQVEGIGEMMARRIIESSHNRAGLDRELELTAQHGCAIVTQADEEYPSPLRKIHDPPLALYRKGEWRAEDAAAVAIVGSRRASLYGLRMAERLAHDLALRGITIISGLALGIDAAAHRCALAAGGRRIAVLGNGLASM